MSNCIDLCPFAGESFECNGECCTTVAPIEVLSDADLERGASHSLIVSGDKPTMNGGW